MDIQVNLNWMYLTANLLEFEIWIQLFIQNGNQEEKLKTEIFAICFHQGTTNLVIQNCCIYKLFLAAA